MGRRDRPLLVGHRANTLAKLGRYLRQGVDAVEVDLYEGFIDHGPDSIKPATLREAIFKRIAALGNGEGQSAEEFLSGVGGRIPLVLDLKSPRLAEQMITLVEEEARRGLIITSKFHPLLRGLSRRLEGATILASIQCRPVDPLSIARSAGARGLAVEVGFVDAELVHTLHSAGMLVAAWTVNDADQARRLVELGVDVIVTERPDLIGPVVRGEAPRRSIGREIYRRLTSTRQPAAMD